MCVIYRGYSVQHVSSSVCVRLSLFTSVLMSHVPPLSVFLLRSQISSCLFHLFSPLLLLSHTLSLQTKQRHSAERDYLFNHSLDFVPPVSDAHRPPACHMEPT